MWVKRIILNNFLSYPSLDVELANGLNVITGANATGKTNLAESLYFSAIGKSARGLKDKELINWDSSDGAKISIFAERRYGKRTLEININKQGKKRVLIDGIPIARMGELVGGISVIYFSPDEIRLIKESPVDRRRFMDISISQRDKVYMYTLMKYNKFLMQRNKVLKNYKNSSALKEMCKLVTEKMLDVEEFIILKRKAFLEKLTPVANEKHNFLTNGKESLELSYETEKIDYSDIKESLAMLYEENFEKDCRLEYTSTGVHRDDIKILASGIDVRRYGSQGQQRTAVLSLKLAEVEMFRKDSGENPILIMDDVLGELDIDRLKALFSCLKGTQTIVTCTEYDKSLDVPESLYKIQNNTILKL